MKKFTIALLFSMLAAVYCFAFGQSEKPSTPPKPTVTSTTVDGYFTDNWSVGLVNDNRGRTTTMTSSVTLTNTYTASISGSATISAATISAEVGYTSGQSFTISATGTLTTAPGRKEALGYTPTYKIKKYYLSGSQVGSAQKPTGYAFKTIAQ